MNQISRTITIDKPVSEVKDHLDKLLTEGIYKHGLKNKNDMLRNYTVIMTKGLEGISTNIQINEKEGKTEIVLTSSEKIRNGGHEIQVNRIIDDFFNSLSDSFSGKSISEITKARSGCVLVAVVLITTTIIVLLF